MKKGWYAIFAVIVVAILAIVFIPRTIRGNNTSSNQDGMGMMGG
ncbi:hypothetical protein [Companilactobacillus furfuricola]|nr:hypothetical protein [Companilactobacillus furfuricola]